MSLDGTGDRMGEVVGFTNVEETEAQGLGKKVLLGRTVCRVSP